MTPTIPPRSELRCGAAYVESGRGAPLVFVHGVGLRAETWALQVAAFAGTRHVVAVDLPGHGASRPLREGTSLPDFVGWLAAALDELALGPADLVGHSMGALVALGAAIERPDLARRIALLNAVYRRTPEARLAVLQRVASIESGALDVDAPLQRWFGDDQGPARRATERWLLNVDRAGYAAAYRAFAEGDSVYADRLARLSCPALFLTGSHDPNSTPDMTLSMARAAPDGRAVVLAGARHVPHLTHPDAVDHALRDWLAGPPGELSQGRAAP